jgi:hypothetical protein
MLDPDSTKKSTIAHYRLYGVIKFRTLSAFLSWHHMMRRVVGVSTSMHWHDRLGLRTAKHGIHPGASLQPEHAEVPPCYRSQF